MKYYFIEVSDKKPNKLLTPAGVTEEEAKTLIKNNVFAGMKLCVWCLLSGGEDGEPANSSDPLHGG